MKAKHKFLLASLLVSASLFSEGATKPINDNFNIDEWAKEFSIEKSLDKKDVDLILSYLNKTKFKRHELLGYYNKETRKEIRNFATEFNVPTKWIYQLFYKECRLNPYATNSMSKAQGTIQFMPRTAKNIGTSIEELKKMAVIEQIPYIKKYLEKINPSKKFESFTDLYLAIFFPKAMGKVDTYVIGSHVSPEYVKLVQTQNKGIDINKNNSITVKEFSQFAHRI